MKTVNEWLEDVLDNPIKMVDWLSKQYHGEATAANRIREFSNRFASQEKYKVVLDLIASQEETHAGWISELLTSRDIKSEIIPQKNERYWKETLVGIDSFETGSAVAAHAELMRLERIRAIIEHPKTPEDIRTVFSKILPDEEFHSKAFSKMAGEDAMKSTEGNHQLGLEALGLVI